MVTPAKLSDVKVGDKVVADDGFSCLRKGDVREVIKDARGELYIECLKGRHYLNGQLNDAGELVGLSVP